MMTRSWLAASLVAACSLAAAQDADWKKTMTTALEGAYPISKTSSLQRNNVTQPGVVLVVKKPGIMAQEVYSSSFPASSVEAGAVSGPKGAGALFSSRPRDLAVGDKVYVRDIALTDDRLRVEILTLEMYDVVKKGSTDRNRFVARVDWHFEKGWLASSKLDELKKIISEVLVSEAEASAPKSIELGQTMADVEKVLGKPETVIKLGAKVTYVYKNMKVIFTDGKVSDVQ